MSSEDGTGVGDTVVLTEKVSTGPTNRFQRSSTDIATVVVNVVALLTVVVGLTTLVGGAALLTAELATVVLVLDWATA